MISPSYDKRFNWFCLVLSLAISTFFAYKYWTFAPLTYPRLWLGFLILFLSLVPVLAVVYSVAEKSAKRIFPPKLVDHGEYAKRARYTPL